MSKSSQTDVAGEPPCPQAFGSPRLISIVIPVYNEQNNVRRCYEAIKEVARDIAPRYRVEIIFTDNHSTDRTFGILHEIAAEDPSVRVLRFVRNFGINKSILTGYRHARGDAAVQIDCDLQDPPSLIPEFIKRWERGHDVVVGLRVKRDESRLLELSRRMYYRLLFALTNDPVIPDAGEFRLVDRSILDQLRSINDAEPYVRGIISSLARRQVGIPYERRRREFDKSKFPLGRLILLAVDGLLSHTILPLRLAFIVGIVISFLALCLSSYYLAARLLFDARWPSGFATLSILILFGTALNALFLGIIGEYLGRIYVQLRLRPTTVIEERIDTDPADTDRPAKS